MITRHNIYYSLNYCHKFLYLRKSSAKLLSMGFKILTFKGLHMAMVKMTSSYAFEEGGALDTESACELTSSTLAISVEVTLYANILADHEGEKIDEGSGEEFEVEENDSDICTTKLSHVTFRKSIVRKGHMEVMQKLGYFRDIGS